MPEEWSDELLPVDPKAEWADAFAFWASVALTPIPVLGTAVSHVVSGWAQERRMERVKEVLKDLFSRVEALGDKRRDDYIGSDEFEDLLDRTLRQAANERHESKRRLYAAILTGAIENPAAAPYPEQLRMLRTIEELQPDHLRVIRAMLEPHERPKDAVGIYSGVPTLVRRLDIPPERLTELVNQLTEELHVIAPRGLHAAPIVTRIPWLGAQDLPDRFTPYGRRLVAYIRAAEEEPK